MPTYNLEEFKAWLATQSPEKQRDFPPNYFGFYQARLSIWQESCQFRNFAGLIGEDAIRVALEWVDTVDHPENYLDYWKAKVTELQAKLTEYETPTASTSDPSETLPNKLARKRQELTRIQTTGRGSTAHLRKEIQLLEKLHALANQITQQQTRETNYQSQIQAKDQALQAKQAEIQRLTTLTNTDLTNTLNDLTTQLRQAGEEKTQLTQQINAKSQTISTQQTHLTQSEQSNSQKQTQINQLTQQFTTLRTEKQALEQRMLTERQTALAQWTTEKANLETQITTLTQEKNTSRQAADYLRTTLSTTETNKADLEAKLATEQAAKQQLITTHEQTQQVWQTQFNQKQEAYVLLQARNTDLTTQLTSKGEELTKLTNWIERLEAASGQGNAFDTLQEELRAAEEKIKDLEGQLSAKKPANNYWWVLVIVALIVLYIMMKT